MERFVPLVEQLSTGEDPIKLIAMLIDDYYQASLHAPVQGPDMPAEPESSQASGKPHGHGGGKSRPRRRDNKSRPPRR